MCALALTPTELDDAFLPRMDASDVAEYIDVMRRQEEKYYSCPDYILANDDILHDAKTPVDDRCRVKMCTWCYQVVDFCQFRRETVSVGMSYLDRYLCTPEGRSALTNRKLYQLVAMTALYIAIKINEPLEMETSLLSDLSRGCYVEMDFVQMEEELLKALGWRLNGPTALNYVQHFLALIPQSISEEVAEGIMDYARYQLELAVAEHILVSVPKQEIAFAAILNSMDGMGPDVLLAKSKGLFIAKIEQVTGLQLEDVLDIQECLATLLVNLIGDDSSEASSASSSRVSYTEGAEPKVCYEASPVCVGKRDALAGLAAGQ